MSASAPGWLRSAGLVAAALGYALLITVVVTGIGRGIWTIPSFDVQSYLAVANRLLSGGPTYIGEWAAAGTVYYAPPIVVAFIPFTFAPSWVLWASLVALEVAGLRYLAGSWIRVGWLSLCIITPAQLVSGNPQFSILAAVLLANRAHAGPVAWAALAKLGPALGAPQSRWRQVAAWMVAAFAITIPWLGLWPEWLRFLAESPRDPGWPILIPLAWRIPLVAGLLALRRPWAQMLAAAFAIPGFYPATAWATAILAWRLWLDRATPPSQKALPQS